MSDETSISYYTIVLMMKIDNIAVRNFNKERDLEDYVEFINDENTGYSEYQGISIEKADKFIFHDQYYDPDLHFIAEMEGNIVGSVMVNFRGPTPVVRFEVGPVLIEKGFADILLDKIIEQLRDKEYGDIRTYFDSEIEYLDKFFKGRGFEHHVSNFEMKRDLSEKIQKPLCPDGYKITDPNPEEIETVEHILRKGFSENQDYIIREFREVMQQDFFDPTSLFVVKKVDEIVGMQLTIIHPASPELGHLCWIVVMKEHRKKGLGMALLLSGLSWAESRGAKNVRLGVDNPGALKLYKNCGFKVTSENIILKYNIL